MKQKTLLLTLVSAALLLAAGAASFDLIPSAWRDRDTADARVTATAPAAAPELALAPAPAPSTAPAPASVPSPAPSSAQPSPPSPSLAVPGGGQPSYRAIIEQYGPAVVGVTVEGSRQANTRDLPPDLDDPFFRFFHGLPGFPGRTPDSGPRGLPFRGQGSGFIISPDGLILTNAHVVRDAREVIVKLGDRREYTAQVLGADPATDIAVLRIDARDLPVVRLGDARQLHVGDPVLAIGSPFGFEQTATQGIVSAKGRSLPGDTAVPFIQIDAAVNPGSSGGPLFDSGGAVVGINAQIYSRSGGYQGLAFAIPINVALKVKDQIVATGRASHARLGVTVQDLNQRLSESFGLSRPDGALISEVAPDSAAAAAGLRPGDIITAVDGVPVVRSGDLSSRISMAEPGQTVRLQVWRERGAREITAKLGRAEDGARTRAEREAEVAPGELGLSLRALTPEEQSLLSLQGGLLVRGATGAAQRAGLRAGDVLLALNGTPLKSPDQVRDAVRKKPESVALLVLRDGERIFVPVPLG